MEKHDEKTELLFLQSDDTRAHADSPKRTIRATTEGYLMGKHETKTTYMH